MSSTNVDTDIVVIKREIDECQSVTYVLRDYNKYNIGLDL